MGRFEKIPINKIKIGKRIREELGDLKFLAKTIEVHGLLNPITVEEIGDGYYLLLAGEIRLEACKLLGWKEIEAHIINQTRAEIECT